MAIKIDGLADAVARSLAEYSQKSTDELKKNVKKVAKEAVKELKANSPKLTGDYASGWISEVSFESADDIRVSVYNAKEPQLTHLAEDGHALVSGGRVEGTPHISVAEEHAAEKLQDAAKVVFR